MISEKKIKELMLDALEKVRDADQTSKDWALNESTIVLGAGSPMDSIAFTFFVTEFEEKMENETQQQFTLNLEELYGNRDAAKIRLSVDELARHIAGKHDSKEAESQSN